MDHRHLMMDLFRSPSQLQGIVEEIMGFFVAPFSGHYSFMTWGQLYQDGGVDWWVGLGGWVGRVRLVQVGWGWSRLGFRSVKVGQGWGWGWLRLVGDHHSPRFTMRHANNKVGLLYQLELSSLPFVVWFMRYMYPRRSVCHVLSIVCCHCM